ncbi:MAG TPA: glycosyltransferase family 39 protein [Gemmataceae bacterium]|nr:glycosyltransferase family 39 protein [Gemmataceae bacterium]
MEGKTRSLSWFRLFAALPAWWSLRLFPNSAVLTNENCTPPRGIVHGIVLAVLSGALLLTRLSCPLLEPEEARYAEIPRQMLVEGRFAEPVLHGEPYYQKPPLLYWLVMLSYSVFGVHDWAVRLVPCLASFATVFVIWLWGRRAFGPRIGFAGAVLLILSGRFIYLGRMLTIDPLLSLWVTAALATGHLAVRQQPLRWRWWLTSALFVGLGLLTKGPVAGVLALAPLVIYQLLDQRCARPSLRALVAYVSVAIGVACPWYVAMAFANPTAAGDFFWVHHVQRFFEPMDHQEPIWFFLPSLLAGTLPWSLLLIPLARWLLRRARVAAATRPPALGFALVALGWCVLFFSLSGCKRAVYILPALPWLAACLGCCFSQAPWRGWRWRPSPLIWKLSTAAVFMVLFVGVYELLPRYHRQFSLRGQIRRHLEAGGEVMCYPKRWDSVSFYLQRGDVRVFTSEQKDEFIAALQERPDALLLIKNKHLAELKGKLPTTLVTAGRQSERLCVLAK